MAVGGAMGEENEREITSEEVKRELNETKEGSLKHLEWMV